MGFESLIVKDTAEVVASRAGRGVSEETAYAMDWLQASLDGSTDGIHGAPKALTAANPEQAEQIKRALERASEHLGVGVDKQLVDVKGGKVEVRYQTRPRRGRTEE